MKWTITKLPGLAIPDCPAGSVRDVLHEPYAHSYFVYDSYRGNPSDDHFLSQSADFASGSTSQVTGFGVRVGIKGRPKTVAGADAYIRIGLAHPQGIDPYGTIQWLLSEGKEIVKDFFYSDFPGDGYYWVWFEFSAIDCKTFHPHILELTNTDYQGDENNAFYGCTTDEACGMYPTCGSYYTTSNGTWYVLDHPLCYYLCTEGEAQPAEGDVYELTADPPAVPPGGDSTVTVKGKNVGIVGGAFRLRISTLYEDNWSEPTWLVPNQTFSYSTTLTNITPPLNVSGTIWLEGNAIYDDIMTITIWESGADCTNPPGADGQTVFCGVGYGGQPSKINKYQCSNGTWMDLGRNCPYCPDCPTAPCSDYLDKTACINAGCEWWNNKCRDYAPVCIELNNEIDCKRYDCYWYDDDCHADPPPPPEPMDYLPYAVIGVGIVLVAIAVVKT